MTACLAGAMCTQPSTHGPQSRKHSVVRQPNADYLLTSSVLPDMYMARTCRRCAPSSATNTGSFAACSPLIKSGSRTMGVVLACDVPGAFPPNNWVMDCAFYRPYL
jgi:hypothetical protein